MQDITTTPQANSRARNMQKDTSDRCGENNPAAVLSDREVELMRGLYEEYPVNHPLHWGYRKLAKKFNVTKTAARKICNYLNRPRLTMRGGTRQA